MKKQIDMLTQLLDKNNTSLPDGAKKKEGRSNFEDNEKFHALVASTVRSHSFIINSGDSRNMISTKESFLYLDDSKGPNIFLGDKSETESKGKGSIDFDHGSFNNVLYVPGLATNLLSVYQMTHTRSPKKVVFSPNEAEIFDIANGRVIAKGFVDHSSKVYRFSHFMPFSNPSDLLTHANEASILWHERFVHINYKYLSYLCEKYMVS